MPTTRYIIALGSNQRHLRHGLPVRVIAAALDDSELLVIAHSRIITSTPLGPSIRRFANAVALIETAMMPLELLDYLKAREALFGRRAGQRWGARVLDLDIILWSSGCWASPTLAIPHAAFRERDFVLGPAAEIAPYWRDPVTGLCVRHLKARLDRKHPPN